MQVKGQDWLLNQVMKMHGMFSVHGGEYVGGVDAFKAIRSEMIIIIMIKLKQKKKKKFQFLLVTSTYLIIYGSVE